MWEDPVENFWERGPSDRVHAFEVLLAFSAAEARRREAVAEAVRARLAGVRHSSAPRAARTGIWKKKILQLIKKTKAMTTWLQHVKQVHASGSTSFKESLKRASASWKKKKGKSPKAKSKKKSKAAKEEEEAPISIEEQVAPKKKKRKRRVKKASPSLPAKNYKNIDSRSLR